jgi:hypothetical protein
MGIEAISLNSGCRFFRGKALGFAKYDVERGENTSGSASMHKPKSR